MDPGIKGVLIGGAITLGGTLLAYVLTALHENRAKKRQIRAARIMIGLEVDHNLLLLRDYHKEVTELTTSNKTIGLEARQIVTESTELPPPVWSHKMWESQMQLLPMALTVDEMKQVHRHHTQLDTTTTIQAEAYSREPQREELKEKAEKGKAWENVVPRMAAEQRALRLGTRLKHDMDEILSIGNPLKNHDSLLRRIARRLRGVIRPKRVRNDVEPKQIVSRVADS